MNLQAINERQIKRFDPIMSHHDTAVMEECHDGSYITWEDHQAAVAQLQLAIQRIERDTLERCAKVAEYYIQKAPRSEWLQGKNEGYRQAAAAIRSLSSKQQDQPHLDHVAGGKRDSADAHSEHGSVPDEVKTWPESVFLQAGDEVKTDVYPGMDDVTWCEHQIDAGDVEYIRVDLATGPMLRSADKTPTTAGQPNEQNAVSAPAQPTDNTDKGESRG